MVRQKNMTPPLIYALVRPSYDEEFEFPHVLTADKASLTLNALDGLPPWTLTLNHVWHGPAGTGQMLHSIHKQLYLALKGFGDATLHIVGATKSGKSHCLLGPRDNDRAGIVWHFAETYYRQESLQGGVGLIELAIYQVCDDQVYDLLRPQHDKPLKLNFNPLRGPWVGELTHHIARNIDEFLSLIRSALSIKAAFSLIEDQFLHATHLCIICSCWHEFSLAQPPVFLGTVTFVEFGSNVLAGMWHDDTEEVKGSQMSIKKVPPANRRVASAHRCSTAQTYLLAKSFDEASPTIWLGCLSPTILDAEDTELTLRALLNVHSWTIRNAWTQSSAVCGDKVEASFNDRIDSDVRRPNSGLIQGRNKSLLTRTRVVNTSTITLTRKRWLEKMGVAASDWTRKSAISHHLVHISSDASISHRLCVSLDEYDVVAFGSSGRTAETVRYHIVRLGNAGISPLHCEICRLQDTSIALKVKPNAMTQSWRLAFTWA
mmetsp:Transcript_28188/g.87212  ORF Transcript_28188/g.87212 Transcript_28188/m.87212 type:complete len:488 (+) Transcript_28188:49-1512(+)